MKIKLIKCLISLYIIACCSLASFPTEKPKLISKTPLWENKKEVRLTHLNTIGSADFEEDEGCFFGLIIDMDCDRLGNLYVLDLKMRNLRKYSPKGTLLKELKLRKGEGPGDFKMPERFALDKDGNIYIADRWSRVSILDKDFNFQRVMKISGQLSDIAIGYDNAIYVTKWHRPAPKKVFKYSGLDGSLLKTFCAGLSNKKIRAANSGYLCTDMKKRNLFYSTMYPNDIKMFSQADELKLYFSRKANMSPPGTSDIITTGVSFDSISMGSAIFPDGKILNLVRHYTPGGKGSYRFWFDVYGKDGKWLISFTGRQVNHNFARFFAIDPSGNLYLDYMHPNPHIKKFKIEFVDKK